MKKKQIYNTISTISAILAFLLMFCIAGGLDIDKLTIKQAVFWMIINFNFYGVAVFFSVKGGQAHDRQSTISIGNTNRNNARRSSRQSRF